MKFALWLSPLNAVDVTARAWVAVAVFAGMVQVIDSVVYVAFVVVVLLVQVRVVPPRVAAVVPRLETGAGKFAVTVVVVELAPE